MSPEALPEGLVEALCSSEALANAEGQERLFVAMRRAGLMLELPEATTQGDMAVHVFLIAPALLTAVLNETRLDRLSAFEYHGSRASTDRSGHFTPPSAETIAAMTADLDAWFATHQRGHETTRIEVHALDGEFWFLLRHGDTFTRKAKVEARRLEILHFRPAKDDVVVYAPKRDEIRIHAGTVGEKDLYRQTFGRRLFGNEEHFCVRKAYDLETLRADCARALDVRGLTGVKLIVLREVELAWGRRLDESMVRKGKDIHGSAKARGRQPIPEYGTVVRAVFDFYFDDGKPPRRVELGLPGSLKLSRQSDARVVHEWLSSRDFRVNVGGMRNGEAMAA
jgi:hypothetical protein